VTPQTKSRLKADLADPLQIGAPIPGLIANIAVTVGAKVAKGDKLLTMEAMKMQASVFASADGVVDAINAQVGDTVESKDLLVKLRAV
jgi:pyruvate carboxylase